MLTDILIFSTVGCPLVGDFCSDDISCGANHKRVEPFFGNQLCCDNHVCCAKTVDGNIFQIAFSRLQCFYFVLVCISCPLILFRK